MPCVSNLGPPSDSPDTSSARNTRGLRRFVRTFDSLADAPYRVYFWAMFAYFAAMQMTVLARPWLAFDLSANEAGERSAFVLGVTVAANTLPALVLSPFAGAVADRMSKRNVLVVAGVLMGGLALLTALGVAAGVFEWWHIAVIGVFQGSVMTFILPSRRAIIPELAREDHLLNAVALHTVAQNVNRVLMPAAAGFIIDGFGAEWAYVTIAGLYGVAAVALLAVPLTRTAVSSQRGVAHAAADGFRYAVREPAVRNLLLIGLVATLFGQPLQHLLPLFQDVLHISVGQLGLLFTFFGVGSLIGSTTAASLGDFRRKGLLLVSFLVLMGLAIVAFSASSIYGLSLVLMVPVGIGHSGRVVAHIATLQSYTAPEMRGRVMALNVMQGGLSPVAVLLITGAAQLFGTQIAIGGAGAVVLAYGLWEMLFARAVRRLE